MGGARAAGAGAELNKRGLAGVRVCVGAVGAPQLIVNTLRQIQGFRLRGLEGVAGRVREVLFDDRSWVVRHIVVSAGIGPRAAQVLLPPSMVDQVNCAEQCLEVPLLHREILALPSASSARPVSAQYDLLGSHPEWKSRRTPFAHGARLDPHLRSAQAALGYWVRSGEDYLGTLADYRVDTSDWKIDSLEVADPGREGGETLLIPAREVERVSLASTTISLRRHFPRHSGVVAA